MDPKQFRTIMLVTIVTSFVSAAIIGMAFGIFGASIAGKFDNTTSEPPRIIERRTERVVPSPVAIPTEEERVVQVVKRSSPSVVSVIISKDVPIIERYYDNPPGNDLGGDLFQQFFGPQFQVPQYRQKGTQKQEVGGGTGFIISADGLILTNKHVVTDESADYTVLFNDGEKVAATVLARDPVEDIAVIKVAKTGLKALPLGDSSKIDPGQFVIAIGNALGEFQNTVSVGVVSGLNRNIEASDGSGNERIQGVIQTDAAINRGNSGGPLLDLNGNVIGMNTAIVLGAQNVGFAIPINKAKRDIESVSKSGKITLPYLGVRYALINDQIAKANNLSVTYGALVVRGQNQTDLAIMPGSPADKAGIVENDIILEMDGIKIDEDHPLANIIADHAVNDTVTLKILHRGEEKTVQVKLEERK